jgi:TonB family protein
VLSRVFQSDALLKRSSHCVSPQLPPLARQARIHGTVSVSILVDPQGKVMCVKAVKGHPLLVVPAMDAAKQWTFRPMTEGGRPVSFWGNLALEFSTNATGKPTSCTSARW